MTQPNSSSAQTNLVMYQVDAFADRVFSGNPAAVVGLPGYPHAPKIEMRTKDSAPELEWEWPTITVKKMQNIANENNLAETAFYTPVP
eukprot:Pgem_evm1s15502